MVSQDDPEAEETVVGALDESLKRAPASAR